jgi:hypothetical protein
VAQRDCARKPSHARIRCYAKRDALSGSLMQRRCHISTAREYATKTSRPVSFRSRANIEGSRLWTFTSGIFTPRILDQASCIRPHQKIVHLKSKLEKRTRSADVFSLDRIFAVLYCGKSSYDFTTFRNSLKAQENSDYSAALPTTAQWIDSVIIE